MRFVSRYISVRHAQRLGLLLATVIMLPALVLSPLTAQALLIHDHHGHDTHGHTVTLRDLDDLLEDSEHRHEKHDHDGLPDDPAEDEGPRILIVLDIPDALMGARNVSATAAVAPGIGASLRTLPFNSCVVDDDPPRVEGHQALEGVPRAHGPVAAILLSNHALLL